LTLQDKTQTSSKHPHTKFCLIKKVWKMKKMKLLEVILGEMKNVSKPQRTLIMILIKTIVAHKKAHARLCNLKLGGSVLGT
jgi:hypothetical protein